VCKKLIKISQPFGKKFHKTVRGFFLTHTVVVNIFGNYKIKFKCPITPVRILGSKYAQCSLYAAFSDTCLSELKIKLIFMSSSFCVWTVTLLLLLLLFQKYSLQYTY